MKKNFMTISGLVIGAAIVMFTACSGTTETNTDGQDSLKNDTTPKVGEIPFDYPVVDQTTAVADEYVLTPSRAFLDDAITKGGDKATFIFYANKMATPGTGESEIKEMSGKVQIPNSLIIPIPAGQEAKKGDLILTWWQSGSGMQRAVVVDDANPKEPVVRYMDLDWDNPATNSKGVGIGQMEETLKPNSFVKITSEWQPGTTVAFKKDGYQNHGIVINVAEDKVLVKAFAGSMKVVAKSDCTPIPVKQDFKVGDEVQVPYIGSYKTGKVKKVDPKIGRAWVEITFGGSAKEIVVAYCNIAKGLKLD